MSTQSVIFKYPNINLKIQQAAPTNRIQSLLINNPQPSKIGSIFNRRHLIINKISNPQEGNM